MCRQKTKWLLYTRSIYLYILVPRLIDFCEKKSFKPYPRNYALWRIWPFLAITHFQAFTVALLSRIFTQNVSLGTFQSSITRSSLITRRIGVQLVSVKSERSVLYVNKKIIVILCILYILETTEFDKQLNFARGVKFQINDVMSAHWPAYYMKTRIITNTLILHQLRKILGDLNDIVLKTKLLIYSFLSPKM